MACVSDIENRTSISEETPLLDDQQANKQPDQDVRENGNAGWYAWRIFWAIFAIILLVVFIRSWIDAGGEIDFDLKGALYRALGGGLSGAAAMVLQVLLLMPLRTIMNYQYRFGTSFTSATQTLYETGGFRRYYQGIGPALIQGK